MMAACLQTPATAARYAAASPQVTAHPVAGSRHSRHGRAEVRSAHPPAQQACSHLANASGAAQWDPPVQQACRHLASASGAARWAPPAQQACSHLASTSGAPHLALA